MLAAHTPSSPPLPIDLSGLTREELVEAILDCERAENLRAQKLFDSLYQEQTTVWEGPSILGGLVEHGQNLYARGLYPKHLEFFWAGGKYRERCLMAANRSGKTVAGSFESACHLTGVYPKWWEELGGRMFSQPISAWVAGDTYETTRDILQLMLLGEVAYKGPRKVMDGRGVIPGHLLGEPTWRSGVSNLVDTIPVKHKSGGWSQLGFKSYDQGRKVFQGTGKHLIWLDEEPPMDVYGECLIRTATLNGIVMLTFTPLLGLSEVVLSFMPADQRPDLTT